jgi:leader peptidase (prepilin peptidase) / N-methyltransferase
LTGIVIGALLVALSPGVGAAAAALCRAYDEGGATGGGFRRDAAAAGAAAAAVALAALLVAGDEAVPAAILGWTLLALALIDLRHGILPDLLTLPLLLLGLAFAAAARRGLPVDEALGAAAGYAAFAGIAALYRRLRGREGLGLGDAKLLAAGGAWLGWSALPAIVAAASLSALGLAALGAARGRPSAADREIRFGPFLCLAVWAVFLYRAVAFL